jgi:signal transduction histidine kinase
MDDKSNIEKCLRLTGLAFFGRLTASASHDINNVLSIVGELSGLLEDTLEAAPESGVPPDRLRRVADGLEAQVQKGAGIVKRLNQFAHSADEPVKSVDLVAQLEAVTALAQRFATLKRMTLQTDLPQEEIALPTNPFLFQQAVFLCIDTALRSEDQESPVTVSAEAHDGGAEVKITGSLTMADDELQERTDLLRLLAEELGGSADFVKNGSGPDHFVLRLPPSQPTT